MRRFVTVLLVLAFLVASCGGGGFFGLDDGSAPAQWFRALPPPDDPEARQFATFSLCDPSTEVVIDDGDRSRLERCADSEEDSGIRYDLLLRYATEEAEDGAPPAPRSEIGDLTAVRLHVGGDGWRWPSFDCPECRRGVQGAEGPVVAVLYDSDDSSGWVMADHVDPWPIDVTCPDCEYKKEDRFEGFLTVADLRGPLAGWTLSELMEALCFGDPVLYIEVHIADDPSGARRSQVAPPAENRPLDGEKGTGGCAWYP